MVWSFEIIMNSAQKLPGIVERAGCFVSTSCFTSETVGYNRPHKDAYNNNQTIRCEWGTSPTRISSYILCQTLSDYGFELTQCLYSKSRAHSSGKRYHLMSSTYILALRPNGPLVLLYIHGQKNIAWCTKFAELATRIKFSLDRILSVTIFVPSSDGFNA